MKKQSLGRGLGTYFGEEALRDADTSGALKLRVEEIEPRADQPRRQFDDDALAELADSIRLHGILQPLAVRLMSTGYYQIIAGERRWRAARLAGLERVPVIVVEADDRRATELALIENLQREDLNPIEEAEGFQSLMDEYGLTQEDVSDRVGKSRSAVANALRLLMLSPGVLACLEDDKISAGHARTLLRLEDAETQERAAKKIIADDLSVRATETLIKKLLAGETPKETKPNYAGDYEKRLAERFGRKVKIRVNGGRGKVELEFYDPEDLEKLIMELDARVY